MLKANSKKVLDIIAGQKKRNAAKAYQEIHPEANKVTAFTNAYQLLKKPEATIYLQEHINKAKSTIVELMDSEKDEIRFKSSEAILDRELGKATQRIEQHTTGITLNLDLTSSLSIEPDSTQQPA